MPITDPATLESNSKLSTREKKFRYDMIKGRVAETIIEELFLSQQYKVFDYGMENTIPGIMEFVKGFNNGVAKEIRSMPDMVVQHPITNEVNFLEVKFRKSGIFKLSELPKDFPYKNALFILVSKTNIKCASYQELEEGKDISPTSRNYLGTRKEFDLDKEVIKEFCDFAIQFFDKV